MCVSGLVAKERILSSPSFDVIRLSERCSFVSLFWHEDHTKSCVSVNPHEPVWRSETRCKGGKDQGRWSVKTRSQRFGSLRIRHSTKGDEREKDFVRWGVTAVRYRTFDQCEPAVYDFRKVLVIATYIHTQCTKDISDLAFLRCCCITSMFFFFILSSFSSYFFPLVKCPLVRV